MDPVDLDAQKIYCAPQLDFLKYQSEIPETHPIVLPP